MSQQTARASHIGTAGWSIPSRSADACPGTGTHLARYARRLNGVEINSSFYRPHRRASYDRWAASVPEDFRFAVKMPKAITHEHRLVGCQTALDRFIGEVGGLGEKLGVLLIQLPPSLAFEPQTVECFFADVRARSKAPLACEPRHASWFTGEASALLTQLEVSRVAADPPPVAGADAPGGWPGLAYFRLHGSPQIYVSDYPEATLIATARRLAGLRASGIAAWCVFDNTAAGHALGNALRLVGLCGVPREGSQGAPAG